MFRTYFMDIINIMRMKRLIKSETMNQKAILYSSLDEGSAHRKVNIYS